ncbi:MAG: two pore domain potassium channel family protein [bacterium]|nr:two pore domain potassium channel family protein [bacterium]
MTTVGYGDIAPQTNFGQAVSACIMILGYGIIAVPTGIVAAQLTQGAADVSGQACPSCGGGGHRVDAIFCRLCGSRM